MLRPTCFGNSCSFPMSSALGSCWLSVRRLVHSICSATYAASILAPDLMHVAMRRRLRLPLPLTALHCGAEGLACPLTGLLPRRGFVVERWVQVAREAVGPEGRVVPQQWLSRTTAPQVHPDDRRPRLRCLRSNEPRRSLVLRRNPCLPPCSRWPPVPGADARAGVGLSRCADAKSRATRS